MPIQEENDKIREKINSLNKNGALIIHNPENSNSENETLSGSHILPRSAIRSLDGMKNITVLMDNEYYVWNTLDALSYYDTDYTLTELYTNWDTNTLEEGIQGADLVLIPYGHWTSNYDTESFKNAIHNYASNGGGVIFTGYNYNEYGVFENSYEYTNWCCGNYVGDDSNEYIDTTHPIMQGLENEVDIYGFGVSYLNNYTDVDTVMTINYWGIDYSRTIFSKSIGSGQVTVFGPYFESWYEDEALMLANAVEFTAGSTMGSVEPSSGVLEIGESVTMQTSIATNDFAGDQHTVNLVIENNDPLNDSLIVPISFNIEPSTITVDPTSFDFGSIAYGDELSSMLTIQNSGGMRLDWSVPSSGSEYRVVVSAGSYSSEVSWVLYNADSWQEFASGGAPIDYEENFMVELDGGQYVLSMYDSWGDGWNNAYFTLLDSEDNIVVETTFNTGYYDETYFDIEGGGSSLVSFDLDL